MKKKFERCLEHFTLLLMGYKYGDKKIKEFNCAINDYTNALKDYIRLSNIAGDISDKNYDVYIKRVYEWVKEMQDRYWE